MSLLGVELRRLFARRAVTVLLVLSVVAAVVVTLLALWSQRPPSDAERERAEALVTQEIERPAVQRDYQRCLDNAETPAQEQRCEQRLPQVEWYLDQEILKPVELFGGLSTGLTVLLGFGALLVGTTFVGAEFSSGSIAPLLLVRPRRETVWAAKLGAVGIGTLAVSVVAWAAVAVLMLLAAWRWAPDPLGGTQTGSLLLQAARGAAMTATLAVVGAAITAAVRSTVAGLSSVVGYLVVAEVVGRFVVPGRIEPWLLSNHALGAVLGRWRVKDFSTCESGERPCPRVYMFDLVDSSIVIAVAVAALLAVSLVIFRRRDIA